MDQPIQKVRQEATETNNKLVEEQQKNSTALLEDPHQLNDFLKQVGDDFSNKEK